MVKNIVVQFMRIVVKDEALQRAMTEYKQALSKPELEFLQTALLTMKGLMAQNLLSKWATMLPKDEKEIMINVYYHINNLIDFLLAPKMPVNMESTNSINFN